MPAGALPAGTWPAGAPLAVGEALSTATGPVAAMFDGATRDVPLDDDGHYLGVHPIDQAVALRCLIARSKLAAHPELGNDLLNETHNDPLRRQAVVENALRARECLGELVEAGDIEIVRIETDANVVSQTNATLAVLTYRNLRILGSDPQPRGI